MSVFNSNVLDASNFVESSSSDVDDDEDDENAPSSPVIKLKSPSLNNNVLTNLNQPILDQERRRDNGGRDRNFPFKENHYHPRSSPTLSSSSSSSASSSEKILQKMIPSKPKVEDEVVLKTKQYLETLGVRFGTPTGHTPTPNPNLNRNNYMIQQ
jgi:hypothetical protein